ncbi:hypothetical protein AB0H58_21940 [Nocardia neocaledoniensis]|uniref:hypothetical protein n=1 Tax=Nocardia neocaledoniensis TaxID=236511 RepID=UPI0033E88AFF
MATVARQSGPHMLTSRQGFSVVSSTMAPATLVTVGLLLLIPVLVTAGPVLASALIARHAGVGASGAVVLAAVTLVLIGAVLAAIVAFRLAWRRGAAAAPPSPGSGIR